MKISILSDLHFGYSYTSELDNDSFDNANEAIEKSLDSDLIILGGDIFDIRAPKTPTWGKAMDILSKPLLKNNPGIKLVETDKSLKEISQRTLNHIPVVSIHGNHERLTKLDVNTVESLENAGLLIHLHLNTIIFEKDGIKVAIHAMSSVPERYAKEVLDRWNPQPISGCTNILLLHQSIDPYVYSPIEPPSLSLSNLPKGFDIIINGHLHGHNMEKIDNTTLIMPGSTVITQFEKNEASSPKVIAQIEIGNETKIEFVSLETARKFIYENLEIENSATSFREQIERKVNQILYSDEFKKKPVIKIKLTAKELSVPDQEIRTIERKYSENAILLLPKEFESKELSDKIELLKNLREQKLSIEELGITILKDNLDELGIDASFDYDTMFKLLSEDENDRALNILLGKQTTLAQVGR
ncbi:MAG: DNA repair exonuclease [Candidatus Aenigmarchaeota archaeon]|nr:DNA repair exonuclease [Candidatus Aenigmarchaeota archaeon]